MRTHERKFSARTRQHVMRIVAPTPASRPTRLDATCPGASRPVQHTARSSATRQAAPHVSAVLAPHATRSAAARLTGPVLGSTRRTSAPQDLTARTHRASCPRVRHTKRSGGTRPAARGTHLVPPRPVHAPDGVEPGNIAQVHAPRLQEPVFLAAPSPAKRTTRSAPRALAPQATRPTTRIQHLRS